jgi:hypothetical protein
MSSGPDGMCTGNLSMKVTAEKILSAGVQGNDGRGPPAQI